MPRPRVDTRVAVPLAELRRLANCAVVAVDQPRADRTERPIDDHDGRALTRQPDRADAVARAEPGDQLAQCRQRRGSPCLRILLGPPRVRRPRRSRAAALQSAAPLEVERRGAGPGCPDVDRDEDVAPAGVVLHRVSRTGRHPRTSWWAAILSRSSVISAPLSAPVE